MELPQTPEVQKEVEEMESVLYSISFGEQTTNKNVRYQAYSAAISNQNHVDLCFSYLKQKRSIESAKTAIFSYRVLQPGAQPDQF